MQDRAAHGAPEELHRARIVGLDVQLASERRKSLRLSLVRLASFLTAAVTFIAGFASSDATWLAASGFSAALFLAAIALHAKVARSIARLAALRDVHERHLARIDGSYVDAVDPGPECPRGHPFARDVDLFGPGSLAHRIDVSHTEPGAAALVSILSRPAPREVVAMRQRAVAELAENVGFRERFEGYAAEHALSRPSPSAAPRRARLDPEPFLRFARGEERVALPGWTRAYAIASPVVLLALFVGARLSLLPEAPWAFVLLGQLGVATLTGGSCRALFDLVAARRGALEPFFSMWRLVEETEFESQLLRDLRLRAFPAGEPPSRVTQKLESLVSRAELRHQFPLHFIVDALFLWDLHVAHGLTRYRARTGAGYEDAFEALGMLEALSSLATLRAIEPGSSFPTLEDEGAPFVAEGLEHPLLPRETRVPNDVRLAGPGAALIITGSNMAGKSTLLRSTGLAIALALAGGPVLARRLSLPPLRLRASMRVDDDLQRGASYYHAELTRLRAVIEDAESSPPVFFLLDELLRGTNAEARHRGARAILEHLLDRGAYGLVATHDVALTAMAEERERVENAHFTDVIRDGAMVFDYALREGVVRGSNALRLLREAGIDVQDDPGE